MPYPGTKWTEPAISDALALWRNGLSDAAIAIVVAHFHNISTTPQAVQHLRHRLYRMTGDETLKGATHGGPNLKRTTLRGGHGHRPRPDRQARR